MRTPLRALMLCALLLTGGCMSAHHDTMIGMPNPYTWQNSVEAAAEASGLPFAAPAVPENWKVLSIASASINGALAQIRYTRPLPDGGESGFMYRISRLMPDEGDLRQRITRFSGDYNSHPEEGSLEADGLKVYTRGHDGLICIAYWEKNFCHVFSDEHGLEREEVLYLLHSLR